MFSFDFHSTPIVIALAALLLALSVSCHAILNRRDPRAAAWWILVVWVMPFVGAVFYYLFGINRIERKAYRLRRRGAPPAPTKNLKYDQAPISVHLRDAVNVVDNVTHLPLTKNNDITPLFNGEETYPAMLEAIDNARASIGFATYIFNYDTIGAKFIAALVRAHHRGVQVRVLIDDVGSGYNWRSVYKELNDHGVPVAYFLPTLWAPWRIAYMNLRNHRKILTVDGALAFTGGLNIHENHMVTSGPVDKTLQDLHFRIEGPVVSQIQDAFRVDWRFTTGEELYGPAWYPMPTEKGVMLARGIADGPDEDFEKCRWAIIAALTHAQKSIRIMTPYLVPDQTLITSLNQAALSGVRVDIVLPAVCDMKTILWATRAGLPQILTTGCRVWETPAPFNHAKLMIVDSEWTFFGSTNWDARSLRLNFEFNVECYDTGLAQKMEAWVDKKIAGAEPITLSTLNARSPLVKLRDGTARLFAPVL